MGLDKDISDIFSLLNKFISSISGNKKPSHSKRINDGKSFSDAGGDNAAVSRAREWVAASMIYHGGPNGGRDMICGGIVKRPHNQQWDKYRSDCSGLIAWAWGQNPPGLTCAGQAPFSNSGSSQIDINELSAGDAINSGKHIMLFVEWIDGKTGTMRVIQSTTCGKAVSEDIVKFKVLNNKTLVSSGGTKFYAIRKK